MSDFINKYAAEQIVSATKLDGKAIDCRQLAYDLQLAWDLTHNAKKALSPAVARRSLRDLKSLVSAARRLRACWDSMSGPAKLKLSAEFNAHDSDFMRTLDQLISGAQACVERNEVFAEKEADIRHPFERGSEFESFVGISLASIYFKHFGLKPTLRRDVKRRVDSPFISFCLATLRELHIVKNGKPYSAEAVARALTAARTNKLRVKSALGKFEKKK